MVIKPLCVGTVGGKPLRFFRPPHDRPDFPWIAVEDLHRCLGLNRALRQAFLRKLREWEDVQPVATPDGVTVIAPHYVAQGLIGAMIEKHVVAPDVRHDYDEAGTEAMKLLTVHIPFGTEAWFSYMKAAMHG